MELSYLCTPNTVPYMYETVSDRLRKLAAVAPDREAFIHYGLNKKRSSLTRKQLLDQSVKTAKILVQSGLKKGSTVVFCMSNSLEMLVTNLGVIVAGGIPFYLSNNLKDGSDLLEFINDLGAEFMFLDTKIDDENWKVLGNIWPLEARRSEMAPSLRMVICNGKAFEETETHKQLSSFLARKADDNILLPLLQPEDTLAYFCTSGSTGKPKEVIYTHFSILNWTKFSNIATGIKEDSIFFCDRTFSWAVGFPRTYLAEGTTRVFVDMRMSLGGKHMDLICDIIESERCDVVYMPGYMVVDLLKNSENFNKFTKVKTILLSGERVQKEIVDALRKNFSKRIINYYGTTESGGTSALVMETEDEFEDGHVGKPLQGVEFKIIDDSGKVMPVGITGELCIRCTWRFAGYRNMENAFREAVDSQGWFHTGDIAHFRFDGNCIIGGRKREMISIATNKYFPWTVERALKNIQGAENAYAVGVPDPRLNQVVCACVLPKTGVSLTEHDVKNFCDETFLEESTSMGVGLKPRYYIILEKVPLTPSGKLDRRTMAALAKEKLGF